MAVFSEMKSMVWGFGLAVTLLCFIDFIGGFRIGLDAAWIEIESLFYRVCDFSLDNRFRGFSDPACRIVFALSLHALILFLVHFTECMY